MEIISVSKMKINTEFGHGIQSGLCEEESAASSTFHS